MEDPDKVIRQIGRRIAELRGDSGLTQAEVAKRIDTAVNNFQRIEHGLQNITIRTMVKIAGALGVNIAMFFEAPSKRTESGRGRPRRKLDGDM